MDVEGWLRGLGLGQYEALFRASAIDADILPELTEVDLEKLGVPLPIHLKVPQERLNPVNRRFERGRLI